MTTTSLPPQTETPPSTAARKPRFGSLLIDLGINIALGVALVLLGAGGVLPALTGGTAMTVMTGSMAPALPPGHVVVYQPVDADSLKVGDVIAYQPDNNITGGVPITHRVIDVAFADGHAIEVTVQGDANPVADKPVKPGQIIGKMVYYIPFLGMHRPIAFHSGLGWVPTTLAVGLVGYGAFLVIRDLLPEGREGRGSSRQLA